MSLFSHHFYPKTGPHFSDKMLRAFSALCETRFCMEKHGIMRP